MCGTGNRRAESRLYSGINLFYCSVKLFTGALVFPTRALPTLVLHTLVLPTLVFPTPALPALVLPTLVLPTLVLPTLVFPTLVLPTLIVSHTKLQEFCALIHTQPVLGDKSDYAIVGLSSSSWNYVQSRSLFKKKHPHRVPFITQDIPDLSGVAHLYSEP